MEATIITPVAVEERKKLMIRAGDTVCVNQKVKEGDKYRLQAFEGITIATKHGNSAGATFTIRRVIDSVGVERIFPLYSPMIDSIKIVKRADTGRAKLYFIREKAAKEIKRKIRTLLQKDKSDNTDTKIGKKEEETAA